MKIVSRKLKQINVCRSWGAVSAGSVLAGIAAALQPETVTLADLVSQDLQEKGYISGSALHNRWIATLAGTEN